MEIFKFLYDELRIYNDTLTAAEVLQHYNGEYIDEDNLVGYWNFSENTGQYAYDQSTNTNTGTLGADADAGSDDPTWVDYAPAWTNGKIGSALEFDGSDDWVEIVDDSSLDSQGWSAITLEAWVYPVGAGEGGIGTIVRKENAYFFDIRSTDEIRFAVRDTSQRNFDTTSSPISSYNTWYHIAVSYDDSDDTQRIYVNGQLEGSGGSASGTLQDSDNDSLYIGNNNVGGYTFNGDIDDVRIYDYARTQAQVAWDYNRGKPIAHWRFDECSGAVAYDESGNDNNGTITIGGSGTNTAVGTCDSENSAHAWYNGVSGKRNYSLDFDGTDDVVVVSDDDLFSFGDGTDDKPFSVSAWVNMVDATDFDIVSKGVYNTDAEYKIRVEGSDKVYLSLYDESVPSCYLRRYYDTTLTSYEGQWIHIVGTYDGSSSETGMRIYLNGIRVDDATSNSGSYVAMENLTHDVWIGKYNTNYTDGQIDDVKIFNYALTAEQVKMEYAGGAARFE